MSVIDTGFDIAGAVSGPSRVLYAPAATVAKPAKIGDIISLVGDTNGVYAPQTGWVDFGLSSGPSSYSRGFDTQGVEYEQPASALFETISNIRRSFTVSIAQLTQGALKIIEEGTAATIAASTNNSAQKAVKFGLFTSRTYYRIALIQQKDAAAVSVVEPAPSGRTRGGLVCTFLFKCLVSADDAEMSVSKGDPTGIDVTFTGFVDTSVTAVTEQFGWHLTEDAGTIL